eukprot:CAMPEP_0201545304 /NCGR_PEP_ID=MMETSP0173_2-20130828/1830_1 /ASSEMBLY_ACC=CAM_ASM_000268 /TAXON_ID=218659 /ORGANISM="Vexillifera sp., Strain DIVA3 564/2" /LENGTH=548 /DNA_ID=CAMNT_0047953665 /DNA_START=23 /DNA_END=1669 /DNA_ORIENTATION=+
MASSTSNNTQQDVAKTQAERRAAANQILMIFSGKDITATMVLQVLNANEGRVEQTIDELLTITSETDFAAASIYKSKALAAGYSVTALPQVDANTSKGKGTTPLSELERIQQQRGGTSTAPSPAKSIVSVKQWTGQDDVGDFLKDLLPNQQLDAKTKQQLLAEAQSLADAKLKLEREATRRKMDLREKELEIANREALIAKEQELIKKQMEAERLVQQEKDKFEAQQAELSKLKAELEAQKAQQRAEIEQLQAQLEKNASAVATVDNATPSSSDAPPAAAANEKIDAPPVVGIYYRKGDDDKIMEDIGTLKAIFKQKGIDDKEIRVVDASADLELQAWLKEKCGDRLPLPMVVIHDQPIGNFDDVYDLIKAKKLGDLLAAGPLEAPVDAHSEYQQDPNAPELSVGVLGSVLNAGEFVMSGVGSLLMLPITLITWPFRSAAEEPPEGVDFLVVHQNWYWRNLHRIFRFTDDSIMRIHPTHKDVRAIHRYDTVEKISVTDESNIVIQYTDGSSPDYIRANPEAVRQMITIMMKKSNNAIKLEKTVLTDQL